MQLGFPEICLLIKKAKDLELSPIPIGGQASPLSESERLAAFLVILGRFSAQGRVDEQEFNFTVEQASKKGISEEDIKILNFAMQSLSQAQGGK